MAHSRKVVAPKPRARGPVPPPLRSVGLVTRDAAGNVLISEAGAQEVGRLAREGGNRALIAARLGVPRKAFTKALAGDEYALLAFEEGQAEHEHEVASLLLAVARKGGAPANLIFYAKARLGWRENDPTVTPTSNVQIVLPSPMTEQQFSVVEGPGAAPPPLALAAPDDNDSEEILSTPIAPVRVRLTLDVPEDKDDFRRQAAAMKAFVHRRAIR